jgi:transketolase
MRTAFIKALLALAEEDDRIYLVVADVGFGVVEPFVERFPLRFLNVGVAEQNMTGIAAGLAMCGKVVFTYSIANFPTLRCLEQIRNDVCYHNADVKIVSVGSGLGYGALGVTHHATEDMAVMRALPNMTVVAPGDPFETELAVRALLDQPGPAYLRLGKSGEPLVHKPGVSFRLGKAIRVREEGEITLIATGTMLHTTALAGERLAQQGIQARILSMHTVKPLDADAVITAARETDAIFTVEEHSILGGLGSAVAETLAESGLHVWFKRLGIPPVFTTTVGSQEYLKDLYSLSVDGIVKQVETSLRTWALSGNKRYSLAPGEVFVP